MKVLFLIDCLGSGGAQRQMVNLAIGLSGKGHHVDFFVYFPKLNHFQKELESSGIKLFSVQKKGKFGLNVIMTLHKLIKESKYETVLSFLDTPNFYAEFSTIGLKVKLVVSERSMYPTGKLSPRLFFLQQLHHLADLITVNSYHQNERMLKEFPWMRNKLVTIYNGVDLNIFKVLAQSNPIDDMHLKIIAIASVSRKKNAKILIEALKLFINRYGNFIKVTWVGKMNIAGEGDKYFREASDLLMEYGLNDHWTWLGESTNIPSLINSHDVLVHPSYFEGLPNVICESLACGRPVFASKVCEHPILIEEGKTGYLFNPNNPDELAEKLYRYSQLDSYDKQNVRDNARQFAEKAFSLDNFITSYEQILMLPT